MTEPLPALMSCRQIMDEAGVKRASAEAIMAKLPKVFIEGHRRVFVYRADVDRYLKERTAA